MRSICRNLIVKNASAETTDKLQAQDDDGLIAFARIMKLKIEAVRTSIEEESIEVIGFNPISYSMVSHDLHGS